MTPGFSDVFSTVKGAVQNLPDSDTVLVVPDASSGMIRIYPKGASPTQRAISAVREISELAYSNAEHHPYWGMLYHCCAASQLLLESWEGDLTPDQRSEIRWRCEEILATIERVS